MSTILTQAAPMGRKARRQRLAAQKIDELSAEVARLRSTLQSSEEARRAKELEALGVQADLSDQLSKLQSEVAQLEQHLADRKLQVERCQFDVNFLKQEIAEVEREKERFRVAHDQVAAELKAIKVARAQNEIDEWRMVGHQSPWKRCFQRLEGWLRKDSDERFVTGSELLRLPPP